MTSIEKLIEAVKETANENVKKIEDRKNPLLKLIESEVYYKAIQFSIGESNENTINNLLISEEFNNAKKEILSIIECLKKILEPFINKVLEKYDELGEDTDETTSSLSKINNNFEIEEIISKLPSITRQFDWEGITASKIISVEKDLLLVYLKYKE